MKRTKYFVWPSIWAASALCVVAQPVAQRYTTEKKPPEATVTTPQTVVSESAGAPAARSKSADAQAILDQLNQERTPMYTEDGQLDPEEVAHVQRMIKLYEMKAGFVDVDAARQQLGLVSRDQAAALAQQQQQSSDVDDLRSQVTDLQQQLHELQQQTGQGPNNYNGQMIRDPAGAQNSRWFGPSHWPGQQYNNNYWEQGGEIKRYP